MLRETKSGSVLDRASPHAALRYAGQPQTPMAKLGGAAFGVGILETHAELLQKVSEPSCYDRAGDCVSQSLPLSREFAMYAVHGSGNHKNDLEH